MRGKSLSDSQPVRRFLHFAIQHEILKKEHSPKFLHDHSHSQHFDGTFILFLMFFSGNLGVCFFLGAAAGHVRAERHCDGDEGGCLGSGGSRRNGCRSCGRAYEKKRGQGHSDFFEKSFTRVIGWTGGSFEDQGKNNTFELGRYFGEKKVGGFRFCVHFFWVLTPPRWQMDQQEGNLKGIHLF